MRQNMAQSIRYRRFEGKGGSQTPRSQNQRTLYMSLNLA